MDAFETFLPFAGTDFNVLILITLGFVVGVLAGFFGMGGGWVMTPALYSFGFPMQLAIGTGLGSITAQGALATMKHRKMGNVDYVLGGTVGASMVLGVEGGKRVVNLLVSMGLAGAVVGWIYVPLLLALAAYIARDCLLEARRRAAATGSGDCPKGAGGRRNGRAVKGKSFAIGPSIALSSCGVEVSVGLLVALGLLVGFLAGLLGTGGGFALVPAFVYLIGTPTLVAVGTSLLCVLISGTYGAFAYGRQGSVEIVAVLWMLAGAVAGTQLGAAATRYVRGYGIRLLYAVMLLLASGGLVMKQFGVVPNEEGESRLAPLVILGGAGAMCMVILGRLVGSLVRERKAARGG